MKQEGHLQAYALTLTARSPVFIGSGAVRGKTEYLFENRTVRMLNLPKFFEALEKRNLADAYEQFVFSGSTNLLGFLRDCGFNERSLDEICLYRVQAADALDGEHSLKEIHTFVRNSASQAYVPGSSVKGALRTVLLCDRMEQEQKGQWPNAFKRGENAQQMQKLEGEYLNTLMLRTDRNGQRLNDAVNSILRGISVSDSLPIGDQRMILTGKSDAKPNGEVKKLPLCRECVMPGTQLRFTLTLDQSVLKGQLDGQEIQAMLARFVSYYEETYLSFFQAPSGAVSIPYTNCLILGGGSGYFAKNLAYPYLGEYQGLRYVAKEMSQQFRRHGHEKDISLHDVSPHTMKYGKYQGKLYPYGLCEVSIQ